MGQLKITDLFSSQPTTPTSKAKAQLKITDMFSPQPKTPSGMPHGVLARQGTQSEPRRGVSKLENVGAGESFSEKSLSAQLTPLKTRTSRFSVQIAAKSPLSHLFETPPASSASIPATPEGYQSNSQKKRPRVVDSEEEVVPEPPQPVQSTSTWDPPRQILPLSASRRHIANDSTPRKQALLIKGSSPFDSIEISSGVDSECELTMIRPSPRKKRKVQGTPRSVSQSTKTATPVDRFRDLNGLASKRPGSVNSRNSGTPKSYASSSSAGRASHRSPSNVGNSSASNAILAKGRSAIKAKVLEQIQTVQQRADSDCFIDTVQPSPRTRLSPRPQKTPTKERRVTAEGTSAANPASSLLVSVNGDHTTTSECDIPKVTPSSKTQATKSTPICSESDTDSDSLDKDGTPSLWSATGPQSQNKSFSSRPNLRRRLFANFEPIATPSSATIQNQPENSPVIDLTEYETSDSNASTNESVGTDPPRQTNHTFGDNPFPAHSIRLQDASSSIDASAGLVKREPSTELSEDEIFYTAPEFPLLGEGSSPIKSQAKEENRGTKLKRLGHSASSSPLPPWRGDIYEFDTESSPVQLPLSRRSNVGTVPKPGSAFSPVSSREFCLLENNSHIKLERDSTMDGSSPLSYHDSSDDGEEIRLAAPRVHVRDASNAGPQSYSSTDSYSGSSSGLFSSDNSDGDELPRRPKDTARNAQPKHEISFDVYNIPRVGAGGYEPRPPPAIPPPYTLKPAYSGDDLMALQEKGMLGGFKPRHRNTLIGLRGILKAPTSSSESVSNKGVLFPPARRLPRRMPTVRDWRTAGLPYLLFTKKKKSLDEVVEESLREQEALRRAQRQQRREKG